MNSKVTILCLFLVGWQPLSGQSERPGTQNFPLVITLEFHSLALPFKDIGSNFSNVGIGIGTELYYGNSPEWAQRFSMVWYRNKHVGNGLLFYSQAIWRPGLHQDSFGELKAGIGYLLAKRPVDSFRPDKGGWQPVGKKGKSMLTIPLGLGMGVHSYEGDRQYSSFLSYQLLVLNNYNSTVPIVPETLIQIGTGVHF